jgi:hypothetical protein
VCEGRSVEPEQKKGMPVAGDLAGDNSFFRAYPNNAELSKGFIDFVTVWL